MRTHMLFSRSYTLLCALETAHTSYTFSFITAHFVHHCTLKQALERCTIRYLSKGLLFNTASPHTHSKGPSIKYVTLEGEGVREGVTVCNRGRKGKEHVKSHL